MVEATRLIIFYMLYYHARRYTSILYTYLHTAARDQLSTSTAATTRTDCLSTTVSTAFRTAIVIGWKSAPGYTTQIVSHLTDVWLRRYANTHFGRDDSVPVKFGPKCTYQPPIGRMHARFITVRYGGVTRGALCSQR